MQLNKLLSRGYLPKELPPCFTTSDYAKVVSLAVPPFPAINKDVHASLATHSLARSGGVRRILGIPNPVLHYHLCDAIAANWGLIKKSCSRSNLSVSGPNLRNRQGRAAAPLIDLAGLRHHRARTRSRGRFLLRADIAECYRSVYTHAISWAVEGRLPSGRWNDYTLVGNKIDRAVRNAQDKQTNGIPVGPDTSFILGEVILSELDVQLQRNMPKLRGFRFYDDYEIVVETQHEADDALATIQREAAPLGLTINAFKTAIEPLPQQLDSQRWAGEIRDFDLRLTGPGWESRLLALFDVVFSIKSANQESTAISYALARLERESWSDAHWRAIEPLLFQSVRAEPSSAPQLARLLAKAAVQKTRFDRTLLGETLDDLVQRHAPLGHASEVAWALWVALALNIKVGASAGREIARMDDVVVALLALDANQKKLVEGGLAPSLWQSWMTTAELRGPHWLVAYEASTRGWLGGTSGVSPIVGDPDFEWLAKHQVSFYRRVRIPTRRDVKVMSGTQLAEYIDEFEER